VKTVRIGLFLFAFVALSFAQNANAGGYPSIGSGWTIQTYDHSMTFAVDTGDLNSPGTKIAFISDTVWYDNLAVCQNNSGKVTFVPGGGQSDPFGFVSPLAQEVFVGDQESPGTCDNGNGSTRACTEQVTYVSKQSDLPAQLPDACFTAGAETPYTCFQFLLGLIPDPNLTCQNKNGRLVELRTKGVCAIVSARVDKTNGSTFPNPGVGYQFTFPSFIQPLNQPFQVRQLDECKEFVLCVNQGGTDCTPPPAPPAP
jgi:hypothetical protein